MSENEKKQCSLEVSQLFLSETVAFRFFYLMNNKTMNEFGFRRI